MPFFQPEMKFSVNILHDHFQPDQKFSGRVDQTHNETSIGLLHFYVILSNGPGCNFIKVMGGKLQS